MCLSDSVWLVPNPELQDVCLNTHTHTHTHTHTQLFHFSQTVVSFSVWANLTQGTVSYCLAQQLLVLGTLNPGCRHRTGLWSINSLKQSDSVLSFLSQNWRDMAIVAEVSGWLFSFWRLAQDLRKDSCLSQLFRGALYSCQGGTKEIWGDFQCQIFHLYFAMRVASWSLVSQDPNKLFAHILFVQTARWWLSGHLSYYIMICKEDEVFTLKLSRITNKVVMKGNSVRKQESWFPKNDLGILLTSQCFIIKLLRLKYDAIPYYNNYNMCVCVQYIFLIFFT